jgi:RND family efflux transporter MFP subunit
MEEELKQKQALVAQAAAQVEQAQAAEASAEAACATAQALVREAEAGRRRVQAGYERWESEYKRLQGLVARKVIDEQTRDETLNQFKAAAAAREEVEAKVQSAEAAARESTARRDQARADVAAAQARRQVAQADEQRMRALLGYAMIRAPFDGVVTSRHVDTGHYLQPATGARGEPLFVVARVDPVRVFVDVPEADASPLRPGAAARVRVQVLHDQEFTGTVTRTSWALDPRTRTLRVEIDLPNRDGRLRPGMYAYAAITLDHPGALTLPAAAVLKQGESTVCYRVEDGKALRTPVQVGLSDGRLVEVLKKQPPGREGVWEDWRGTEEVVANNPAALADGQAVRVAKE